RVREADKTGVGDQPEFERDPVRLARLAQFGHPWRLMRARRVVRIAEAAPPTARDNCRLARFGEVRKQFAGIRLTHGRSRWHGDPLFRTTGALARFIRAVDAGTGLEMGGVLEWEEGIEMWIDEQDDIAAAPAIATVRAATRLELLAPERGRP